MEAASPVCRWLFAAGLVALAGCQSGGTSAALNARGQSPSELPAPLSPASLPPVTPSQPIPAVGPVTPLPPLPSGSGPMLPNAPVQGLPINSSVTGGPVQGFPINSSVAGGPVQGFPINSGPITPVGMMVVPPPNRPTAVTSMALPSDGITPTGGGWLKLTDSAFAALRKASVPETVLATLTPLKDKDLPQEFLMQELAKILNPDEQDRWIRLILTLAIRSAPQVKVMAQVGSSIITDQEVIEGVHMRLDELRDLTGPALSNKEKELYKEELVNLIERELLIEDVLTRLKKNKKSPDEIKEIGVQTADERLREIKKQQGIRTEEEFIRKLSGQGLTIAVLRRKIERETMAAIYVQGVLKETARSPGFADIRKYYDQHPEEFQLQDRVRWQGIFISFNNHTSREAANAHAQKVRQMALEGNDFVSLIKAEENAPRGRQNWDGIGTTRQTVPLDVAPAVWSLQPGQISDLIETPGGYHIVKVLEREYAGLRPFDIKAQNECHNKLQKQYRDIERRRLIDDLWRKGTVEVFAAY